MRAARIMRLSSPLAFARPSDCPNYRPAGAIETREIKGWDSFLFAISNSNFREIDPESRFGSSPKLRV